jgi:gamma-glutamylcyclotransferase (GGCT)/AIG2-like uncharacterized protein YtfP
LQREAKSLGPATIQGRLYDFGQYPGLVESDDPGDLVHGEVYALADPSASFRWLDAYEGTETAGRVSGEYERVVRPVEPASGSVLNAWVYLYARDISAARWLPEGRWPGR